MHGPALVPDHALGVVRLRIAARECTSAWDAALNGAPLKNLNDLRRRAFEHVEMQEQAHLDPVGSVAPLRRRLVAVAVKDRAVSYWISYRTQNEDAGSNGMEKNDTALGAYARAIILTEAGGIKIKIRDGDTLQSWDVEAFAARHGLSKH